MLEKFSSNLENIRLDASNLPKLSNLAKKEYLDKMCAGVGMSTIEFIESYKPDSPKKEDREIYCNFVIGAAMMEFNHFHQLKKYDDCLSISKKIKEYYITNYFDLDKTFRRDIEDKFKKMNDFFSQLSKFPSEDEEDDDEDE